MMSVIIPACNEEGVIVRCLTSIRNSSLSSEILVVVVCNGCSDDTAARARAVEGLNLVVCEIDRASKVAALNAGDQIASDAFPRVYVDADVLFASNALAELRDLLAVDICVAAAPRMRVDVIGRPWIVVRYYAYFLSSNWVQQGLLGSGVYGVSQSAWVRIAPFPNVVNDDKWVSDRFDGDQVKSCRSWFEIPAPYTLSSLVKSKARVMAGERELGRMYEVGELPKPRRTHLPGGVIMELRRARRAPVDCVTWFIVRGLIRMRFLQNRISGEERVWNGDRTTRGEVL